MRPQKKCYSSERHPMTMNLRDPKMLFGAGVLGFFALLALTDKGTSVFPSGPISTPPPFPINGPVKWTAHLSDAFFRGIHAMTADFQARGAKVTAEDFLGVLNAESGVRASAMNPGSKCAGMNQICPTLRADPLSGLKGVGFTGSREDYLALTAEAQLPFVRRWFTNASQGKFSALTNMGRLYCLNIAPAHVGRPDDFPLYVKGRDGDAYTLNASLDRGGKGFITVADTDAFVHRSLANGPKGAAPFEYWNELRMRLARNAPGASVAGLNDEEAMIRIALSQFRA